MTTRQTIKRFLEPLFQHLLSLSILFFRGLFFGFQGSILAIAIQRMIDGLVVKDRHLFKMYLIVIIMVFIIKDVLGYFVRVNDFKLANSVSSKLYGTYLNLYFRGKNTLVDQMGTGKSNSIIIRGIDNWVAILRRIPQNLTAIIVGILTALFIVATNLGWLGFVGVFLLFGGSFWLAQFGNRQNASRRKKEETYIMIWIDIQLKG